MKSSRDWDRADLARAPGSMWRYAPLLPPVDAANRVSMGEGWTPLRRAPRLGAKIGATDLWLKDETVNPTASWEARAFSCVASLARERGLTRIETGANENAALACAAYAACAGLESRVALPSSTPRTFAAACTAYGAGFHPGAPEENPARMEGLKTIAFELAEQCDWSLPSLVFCPEGDALRRGFAELAERGEVRGEAAVIDRSDTAPSAARQACRDVAALEGVLPDAWTGAAVAQLWRLIADGAVDPDARFVIVISSSGLPYSASGSGAGADDAGKLGGLITPR